MPKRNSKARPTDVNQIAHLLVEQSTQQIDAPGPAASKPPVSRAVHRMMQKMGSKGGKIGGKRRMVTMTRQQRSEAASVAAKARWKKAKSTAER
jgi:hypothetical protein